MSGLCRTSARAVTLWEAMTGAAGQKAMGVSGRFLSVGLSVGSLLFSGQWCGAKSRLSINMKKARIKAVFIWGFVEAIPMTLPRLLGFA